MTGAPPFHPLTGDRLIFRLFWKRLNNRRQTKNVKLKLLVILLSTSFTTIAVELNSQAHSVVTDAIP